MFAIGDYVTRKSYNNDIVFKIVGIQGALCLLKGVSIRLFADSDMDDLNKHDKVEGDDFDIKFEDYKTLDRNEYFYLPGKVLHIDSDISLSNDLANPYKIRKKAKNENNINHQKNKKMSKI